VLEFNFFPQIMKKLNNWS